MGQLTRVVYALSVVSLLASCSGRYIGGQQSSSSSGMRRSDKDSSNIMRIFRSGRNGQLRSHYDTALEQARSLISSSGDFQQAKKESQVTFIIKPGPHTHENESPPNHNISDNPGTIYIQVPAYADHSYSVYLHKNGTRSDGVETSGTSEPVAVSGDDGQANHEDAGNESETNNQSEQHDTPIDVTVSDNQEADEKPELETQTELMDNTEYDEHNASESNANESNAGGAIQDDVNAMAEGEKEQVEDEGIMEDEHTTMEYDHEETGEMDENHDNTGNMDHNDPEENMNHDVNTETTNENNPTDVNLVNDVNINNENDENNENNENVENNEANSENEAEDDECDDDIDETQDGHNDDETATNAGNMETSSERGENENTSKETMPENNNGHMNEHDETMTTSDVNDESMMNNNGQEMINNEDHDETMMDNEDGSTNEDTNEMNTTSNGMTNDENDEQSDNNEEEVNEDTTQAMDMDEDEDSKTEQSTNVEQQETDKDQQDQDSNVEASNVNENINDNNLNEGDDHESNDLNENDNDDNNHQNNEDEKVDQDQEIDKETSFDDDSQNTLDQNEETTTVSSGNHWTSMKKYCLEAVGQYAVNSSCHEFVNCWNYVPHPSRCNNGLLFNDKTGNCDWPENVDCGDRPKDMNTPKVCSEAPFGAVRNPEDCSEFYVCVGSEPMKHKCPDNLNYNDVLGVCDFIYRVDCKGTPSSASINPGPNIRNRVSPGITMTTTFCKPDYIWRISSGCKRVDVCSEDGRVMQIRCPTLTAYDLASRKCIYEGAAVC